MTVITAKGAMSHPACDFWVVHDALVCYCKDSVRSSCVF